MVAVGAITLVALEFGFRFARDLVRGSPSIARIENIDDDELGWALNPDRKTVSKINACNEAVVRKAPAGKYLLKAAPPAASGGLRVLFLGDSFTQGTETSTDGLYFEVFEKIGAGRYAVSAAGIGGFNTAQEYRLLEKVLPVAAPKIVFWQLSSNDISENVHAGTDISTVQKPRLYYDPASDSFAIRNPAWWPLQHSELAKYLYGELMKIERGHPFGLNKMIGWVAPLPAAPASEVTRRGLLVMERLLAKAMKAHPEIRFVGFSADGGYDSEYRAVFAGQGAAYITGLAKQVRAASAGQRIDCAPIDSHWNHLGNRVAASALLDYANRAFAAPYGAAAR